MATHSRWELPLYNRSTSAVLEPPYGTADRSEEGVMVGIFMLQLLTGSIDPNVSYHVRISVIQY